MKTISHFKASAICVLLLALTSPGRAAAPTNDDGLPPPLDCPGPSSVEVMVSLATPDLPPTGCRVKIEAGGTRLIGYGALCHTEIFTPRPNLPVQWTNVNWPAGATPVLVAHQVRFSIPLAGTGSNSSAPFWGFLGCKEGDT